MKISINATSIVGGVFATACLAVAVNGFLSLRELADPVQRSDALGFAWFWAFLGAIGVGLALAAWWIGRREEAEADAET